MEEQSKKHSSLDRPETANADQEADIGNQVCDCYHLDFTLKSCLKRIFQLDSEEQLPQPQATLNLPEIDPPQPHRVKVILKSNLFTFTTFCRLSFFHSEWWKGNWSKMFAFMPKTAPFFWSTCKLRIILSTFINVKSFKLFFNLLTWLPSALDFIGSFLKMHLMSTM